MTSHRIEQVNELIRRELGAALPKKYEAPMGFLVTIEEVATTKDLSRAKIAVSVLPAERGPEVLKELLLLQEPLRRILQGRLHMKLIPRLVFVLDHREEKADRIHRMLDAP